MTERQAQARSHANAFSSSGSVRWRRARRAPIGRSTISSSSAYARATPRRDLDIEFAGLARFEGLIEALAALKPDAVAICTDTKTR
jgi:hypothetical protein